MYIYMDLYSVSRLSRTNRDERTKRTKGETDGYMGTRCGEKISKEQGIFIRWLLTYLLKNLNSFPDGTNNCLGKKKVVRSNCTYYAICEKLFILVRAEVCFY